MTLRPLLYLFLLLGLLCEPGLAAARSVSAEYSISIRGFPVGKAEIRADIVDRRYRIAFSARVTGVMRLFSDVQASAEATGTLGNVRPRAEDYSHVWVEDDETETVSMHFVGAGVADIQLDPPQSRPERYVPMTAAHKANAVDLVSAVLWPIAGDVSAATCNRILPLIDGKRRFNIAFDYKGTESFATQRGSRYRKAVVCGMDYRPISGHRRGRADGGFLQSDGNMEVWLAAAGDGLAVPVRVELPSKVGRVILNATRLDVE